MKNNGAKYFAVFIAGLATGAALGILLAPDKGSNTRRKIKEKFSDLGEKATEQIKKFKKKKKDDDDDDND